jgi:hypothetical protein
MQAAERGRLCQPSEWGWAGGRGAQPHDTGERGDREETTIEQNCRARASAMTVPRNDTRKTGKVYEKGSDIPI